MEETMPSGMRKPGMKKGEVKESAERKKAKIDPMLQQEERTMPHRAKGTTPAENQSLEPVSPREK